MYEIELRSRAIKSLPNIFLDSHYKDAFLYATEYAAIDSSQRVELEGEFNNFFQLYVPSRLENLALKLVTPDVMMLLLEDLYRADMYISSNIIMLRTNHPVQQENIIKALEYIANKVARFLRHSSQDDQILIARNRLIRDTNNEAIKVNNTLVSSLSVLNAFILSMYAFFFSIFYVLADFDDKSWSQYLAIFSVCLLLGMATVVILNAYDKYKRG